MTPTRLVLDTNIVMDMLHFAHRHALPLHAAIVDGRLNCCSDSACLNELERVAGHPEFGLAPAARAALVDDYRKLVTLCEACGLEDFALPRCRDGDDQKFLILAARCQADLLVTRDRQLLRLARHRRLPPPLSIVTAETACRLLQLAPEDPARAV